MSDIFTRFRRTHCGCPVAPVGHDPATCANPLPVLYAEAPRVGDPDDTVVLYVSNGRGADVLAVTADGRMHFAPGYTPSQQAEAFRQAVNMATQRAIFPLLPEPDAPAEGQ